MSTQRKNVQIMYNEKDNTVIINDFSNKILPDYLKYLFEYLKIPTNTQIFFLDKAFKDLEAFKNKEEMHLISLTDKQINIIINIIAVSDEPIEIRKELIKAIKGPEQPNK